MKSSIADRIMEHGISQGESNRFVSAERELRQKRAKVPPNCTLYLIYGGTLSDITSYTVWPAMDGSAGELKGIRRTCRKRGWRCTYYIVEDNTVNVR